ncbi:hypothetical protein Htur_1161 [Haloterrigena turkmenica DSM 5511]|uniref:DUF5658 domain-containing protein n=2 Tax=Haloterrigena turkmenica TaxID=62320 RepID=D2RZC9_HALTV|nr:hypothetical protein Htur_1161 [Haloterrigena turkmenica DSM 5511]
MEPSRIRDTLPTVATVDHHDIRFDSGGEPMSSDGAYPQFDLPLAVSPTALERALWVLVALSLLGDVLTTFAGLRLGLVESNPVARSAIDGHGFVGMFALKGLAIAIGLVCRPLLPAAYRAIVPAGLAVPWTIAVCINLYAISTVM